VIEPDDFETWRAIDRLRLGPPFEIIVAPDYGPRTKPKALNAALPFARGAFVAVFDAEDRPEPDQLRLAYDAFVFSDERLACVQARLTIDNTADSLAHPRYYGASATSVSDRSRLAWRHE
jgi:cellulose synthase/poly-beta-1,6-N-acetylglucosamine synthase-like glycosyltransferase